MIPEIGVVVATVSLLVSVYISTRMLDLIANRIRTFNGVWSFVVIGLAAVTILVAAATCLVAGAVSVDLITSATTITGPAVTP